MKMKKLLSLVIVMMSFAIQALAEDIDTDTTSQGIMLEITQYNETTGRHRSKIHLSVEAWYNASDNTIEILYDGESEGEVYIYMNGNIVNYDLTINTSLKIPSLRGLYAIRIVTETWYAQGYLQL
jgi:hypothetical protein